MEFKKLTYNLCKSQEENKENGRDTIFSEITPNSFLYLIENPILWYRKQISPHINTWEYNCKTPKTNITPESSHRETMISKK